MPVSETGGGEVTFIGISSVTNQKLTQPSKIAYSITHAFSGQVGFCVPQIAEDPKYIQRLRTLLEAERWVTSEQVNTTAGSIVITYKPGVIPDAEMRSHFANLIQSASEPLIPPGRAPGTAPTTHLNEANQRAKPPSVIAYSIAHAIPGRVRFRVPRIAADPEYVRRLQALLETERWVTSERVNTTVASVVITYQSGVMPDAQMRSHFASLIQSAST